ncbi:hypothetical protein ERO13_A06G005600v2 [Gossypium hirsutum]|uniref:Protein IQ-DOMAIN 32 n=1 Tax=Gossypium hirsutum TaxID=3635 RepID=A0ABM3BUD3_GOSHI|nr:protein IQ-DOMAIN 32-like [Gossypium hirsutum]KAG4193674.1 hypothetical protein ERO13_A06G005600v2 [Gossypium hirsutum]
MGRSISCFKIITCGTDSADKNEDFIDVPQDKRSSDKKGWSFRKRSERHRVLSNTVVQEASTGLEESPEAASYVQQSDVSVAPEKTSTVQYTEEKLQPVAPKDYVEEKSQLSTQEDSKVSEPVVAATNEAKDDANMDESDVVVVQTAIRGFLARKELGKLKNLVKLQAALRGHLVRRHAVGTLRCIQAIVKMQMLVRAHHARLSQECSYSEKNAASTSIEKLLSNRFARQLLDSTPKTKPIHINCDPSKPSSGWSWLERWMSTSSSEKTSTAELPNEQLDATVPSEAISESNDVNKTMVSSESEENLITYVAADSKSEACLPTSSVTGDLERTRIDNMSTSDLKETSLDQTIETEAHCLDVGVESLDAVSSGADTISRSKEPNIAENPVLRDRKGQHYGSECGTELSVTSTLDSPDRYEVGTVEYENGVKVSEQENCSSNGAKDLNVKENATIAILVPGSSLSIANQPDKLDDTKGEPANLVAVDSPRVEHEPCRLSPEASPRSHMTVPESQGTPSSQVSIKSKKKKTEKSGQKRKSFSTAKGSPTANRDSGAKSSTEQPSKDQRSGKRHNSFGSTKPDNIDEEPRDSNSSNSLPRFMQATESARAKVNANNSPRSSPDVQDGDLYIKKRRSLPGANGKQHSPRIQPSLGVKGNDRKWQR